MWIYFKAGVSSLNVYMDIYPAPAFTVISRKSNPPLFLFCLLSKLGVESPPDSSLICSHKHVPLNADKTQSKP